MLKGCDKEDGAQEMGIREFSFIEAGVGGAVLWRIRIAGSFLR